MRFSILMPNFLKVAVCIAFAAFSMQANAQGGVT